ncbi:hydroxyethylthiazole kinase [Limnochorda pilosa]|uniref:Hydroxyethylthiazole kinase n=1 Tax=Limnochorda pilosa TaxID=1555112 RepID=A0A0K2SJG9_LIMPI|nr:hydroxyethylthiazole kinase [Limnochorda pilosa]BAS27235.1 hydroxyethylthiazole kinase [Limnochorda pilosa]
MSSTYDLTLHETAAAILERLRREVPLIHHITNLVVTNVTANATLAVGASPVMAHAPEEVAEMARVARALVLNIGTLSPEQVEAMLKAGRAAAEAGVPIVLDPVGAGATSLRTESSRRLLAELPVSVVRGNAAELSILAGGEARVRGVDAVSAGDTAAMARELARAHGLVAAATGATDYVTDGERTLAVENGHPWLRLVTGTGCMATSVVAAFAAVHPDRLEATAAALAYYGLAAERAAAAGGGPGTFQVHLMDQLHALTPDDVRRGARIRREG